MFKKLIVPFLLLLVAGCASNEIGHSKDVNQDEINQGYTVYYDGKTNVTTITAFLRFAGPNGTTLILDEPSSITFDQLDMEKNETRLSGCFYQKVIEGELGAGRHTFKFIDINGKEYSNSFDWSNVAMLELPADVSKTDNLKIRFDGFKDRPYEKLEVQLYDTANSVNETFERVGLDGKVVIPKEKLQSLNGASTLTVERTGSLDLKEKAHGGGYIITRYVLPQRQLNMVQ